MDFELHQGGDAENPQERTSVRDWGERGQTGTASLNSAYAGPEGARLKVVSRGKRVSPRELTQVSDGGEQASPTHMQRKV